LFNTSNGAALILPTRLVDRIRQGNLSSLEGLPNGLKKFILDKFMVEDIESEPRLMIKRLRRLRNHGKMLALTIVTTLDCNLACVYCYQKKFQKQEYMSMGTANDLVSFVKGRLHAQKFEKLNIHFFGGEPLLNLPVIETIATQLNGVALEQDITLEYTMDTNGILLTRDVATMLKSIGISSVQVTFDGPREIHDSRRPSKNLGESSFDIAFRNVLENEDIINIVVRCNVDRHNLRHIPELMKIVKFSLSPKTKFYMGVVHHASGKLPHCQNFCLNINAERDQMIWLWKKQSQYGLRFKECFPAGTICGYYSENSLTIDPSGNIYVCEGSIGLENFRVGHLRSSIDKSKLIRKGTRIWTNCSGCVYFPTCLGGCRVNSYLLNGDFSKDCRKEFFDNTLRDFFELKYKQAKPDEGDAN
jgi:uncharacterized protein